MPATCANRHLPAPSSSKSLVRRKSRWRIRHIQLRARLRLVQTRQRWMWAQSAIGELGRPSASLVQPSSSAETGRQWECRGWARGVSGRRGEVYGDGGHSSIRERVGAERGGEVTRWQCEGIAVACRLGARGDHRGGRSRWGDGEVHRGAWMTPGKSRRQRVGL